MRFHALAISLALSGVEGFQAAVPSRSRRPSRLVESTSTTYSSLPKLSAEPSPLFSRKEGDESTRPSLVKRILNRLDTIESAGLEDVKVAGIISRIKSLHNPISYIVLALMAGLRWKWCFRNPYYWFGFAFCIKWYRARYVFKIPVWDRQPNWNNIITSKEQEKDLKAFTCKNCGSTLFIAKTREFFFEGDTGIGGLGCFSCGAKGADNFIMDRDRIVEDVADMDDYFEYERPLDFVSRAERRKLLKEAGGDEEKANEILVAKSASTTETDEVAPSTEGVATNGDTSAVEGEAVMEEESTEAPAEPEETAAVIEEPEDSSVAEEEPFVAKEEKSSAPEMKKETPKEKTKAPPPTTSDDLDALGMDDF